MAWRPHESLWPPRIGDYARVRDSGTLGEVIEIARHGDEAEYTVNLLAPSPEPISAYALDDLVPVWPPEWVHWPAAAQ